MHINRRPQNLQGPQNLVVMPHQVHSHSVSECNPNQPSVPISPPTQQFRNGRSSHYQHPEHELRHVGSQDIQIPAYPDEHSGNVNLQRESKRERQYSQNFAASPSDVNPLHQKPVSRSDLIPQGPTSVPYDIVNAQRQASDHQSVQTSATSTSRSGGSKAPQPHYLPKRLVMPTPLQFQTPPPPQQHPPQQSQPRSQSKSSLPSPDKNHFQPRAQDIPMASSDRKVLRKRTSTGVDMRNVPLPTHVPTPTNELLVSSRVAFATASFGIADPTEGIKGKRDKAPKRVLSKRRNDI